MGFGAFCCMHTHKYTSAVSFFSLLFFDSIVVKEDKKKKRKYM
jgi:hypothetical protein